MREVLGVAEQFRSASPSELRDVRIDVATEWLASDAPSIPVGVYCEFVRDIVGHDVDSSTKPGALGKFVWNVATHGEDQPAEPGALNRLAGDVVDHDEGAGTNGCEPTIQGKPESVVILGKLKEEHREVVEACEELLAKRGQAGRSGAAECQLDDSVENVVKETGDELWCVVSAGRLCGVSAESVMKEFVSQVTPGTDTKLVTLGDFDEAVMRDAGNNPDIADFQASTSSGDDMLLEIHDRRFKVFEELAKKAFEDRDNQSLHQELHSALLSLLKWMSFMGQHTYGRGLEYAGLYNIRKLSWRHTNGAIHDRASREGEPTGQTGAALGALVTASSAQQ